MNSDTQQTLSGLAASRGLVAGPVFLYRGDWAMQVPEFVVEPGHEQEELLRFRRTVLNVKRDLEGLIAVLKERTGRSDVKVFECHLMIIEDSMLQKETTRYILEEHLNAEAAVRRTANNARSMFERMNDPYFRERVRDLDDVERRLLRSLSGFEAHPKIDLTYPSIVIADDLTPSETVQLPREYVLGFATNKGSATSHVALLARTLSIPAVCALGDITSRVSPGETVLLDGVNGTVTVHPDKEELASFENLIERTGKFINGKDCEAPAGQLKSGGRIILCANAQPGVSLDSLKQYGAHSIGLYRTEYLWLSRELEPTEEEQFATYKEAVMECSKMSPESYVTIRLLDIGGDKIVRGISSEEANPFLGNRSIRYLLSHRDALRRQLRAIFRASAFGNVRIMCPMVSCVEEVRETLQTVEAVKLELSGKNIPFDKSVKFGVMIEIPAAALIADDLARQVDFFSLGTNDLVQYTMAADRGNSSVSYLYQPLHPAVLKLVSMTVAAAKRAKIDVEVCGESASDPVVGPYWAALGVDALSMSATYIPQMSRILGELTRADLDEYAKVPSTLPCGTTGDEVFAACRKWLLDKLPNAEVLLI